MSVRLAPWIVGTTLALVLRIALGPIRRAPLRTNRFGGGRSPGATRPVLRRGAVAGRWQARVSTPLWRRRPLGGAVHGHARRSASALAGRDLQGVRHSDRDRRERHEGQHPGGGRDEELSTASSRSCGRGWVLPDVWIWDLGSTLLVLVRGLHLRDPDDRVADPGGLGSPSHRVPQVRDARRRVDAFLGDDRCHSVRPHHDEGSSLVSLASLEGGGRGDAAIQDDHIGSSPPKDPRELVVIRGEPDDVEPFAFQDETKEPIGTLRFTQDDLHSAPLTHLRTVPRAASPLDRSRSVMVRRADSDFCRADGCQTCGLQTSLRSASSGTSGAVRSCGRREDVHSIRRDPHPCEGRSRSHGGRFRPSRPIAGPGEGSISRAISLSIRLTPV